MIGQTLGHYRILEKVGEGGMGVVYKAEDTRLRRQVALKVLAPELTRDEEAKHRFVREAQTVSGLQHHNICTIHDIDEDERGRLFICMDYYDGESVKSAIARGPMALGDALDIAAQVAQGLADAHARGIIHRDIKPGNILITRQRIAKIVDFGLAKLSGDLSITRTGLALGTAAYMSPEQARGEPLDPRTDIWSLGVVLYEMVAGHRPFAGEHEQSVIHQILTAPVEPLASVRDEVPAELDEVVRTSLEKDRERRYRDVSQQLVALRSCRANLPARPASGVTPSREHGRSVAVLPFVNMTADREQDYFCDGLAEEIINALTHVEDLRVAARTSSFALRTKQMDVREIGRALGVDTVLEGSVRKSGTRVRITAQLVNVADGYHQWSERFDRQMDDIFSIQDGIALAVLDTLKVKLLKDEKAKVVKRHTVDQEAYSEYLRGRYFWDRRYEVGLQKALEYFSRAIERDPSYALAHAGIADCYTQFAHWAFMRPLDAQPRAKAAATRALQLDPDLSEAHASMGWIHTFYDWDYEAAEREFEQALALNSSFAQAHEWYGLLLGVRGRFDSSLREGERALALEPLSLVVNAVVGLAFYWQRRHDEALVQFRRTLELDPNFGLAHMWQGFTAMAMGRWDMAVDSFTRLVALWQGSQVGVGYLGAALAMAGRREEALTQVARLDALSKKRWVSPFYAGIQSMALGDKDAAFAHLDQACIEREPWMPAIATFPLFDPLRDDARFPALLTRMGLQ